MFIAVEGCSFLGKTTFIDKLVKNIAEVNKDAPRKVLRRHSVHSSDKGLSYLDGIGEVEKEFRASDADIMIADRYYFSNAVYQNEGSMPNEFKDALKPDLLILFCIDTWDDMKMGELHLSIKSADVPIEREIQILDGVQEHNDSFFKFCDINDPKVSRSCNNMEVAYVQYPMTAKSTRLLMHHINFRYYVPYVKGVDRRLVHFLNNTRGEYQV